MLGPVGILVQPTSENSASKANNSGIFRILAVPFVLNPPRSEFTRKAKPTGYKKSFSVIALN